MEVGILRSKIEELVKSVERHMVKALSTLHMVGKTLRKEYEFVVEDELITWWCFIG